MGLVAGMPRPGGGLSFPCILEGSFKGIYRDVYGFYKGLNLGFL